MSYELKGGHVLAILLAFFGVTVGVNAIFTAYAIATFSGEDIARPYLSGLAYNETLAARAAQQRLGWTTTIALERRGAGDATLRVRVTTAAGAALSGLIVAAKLRRPTDSRLDRDLPLDLKGDTYEASVPELASGQWDVIVRTAAADGTPFEARRRVVLP
jgi:nitrogen fixation protein FixH